MTWGKSGNKRHPVDSEAISKTIEAVSAPSAKKFSFKKHTRLIKFH
jgi:uncharacterized radical SAM superfamily protein